MELVTGTDGELVEDLVQVVFDSPWAHEELGTNLRVGLAVAGQPGDLGFAGGELVVSFSGAYPYALARGTELARGSLREPVGSH
jgi:hypothetical protein